MRKHAPHVTHWVTGLWKTRPADLEGSAELTSIPADLTFFFEMVANDYLPYLEANARAVAGGEENVSYSVQGVEWGIPSAPYRADCFNQLKQRFAGLDDEARSAVCAVLPEDGVKLLDVPTTPVENVPGRRGRLGRASAFFG